MQEVKTEIESAGGTAQIMQCDVADAASCDEMFQTIMKEFGRIDILVNNAGITRDGLLMKMAEEDFDAVIDTNLKGTFHCIRAVSRQMLRQCNLVAARKDFAYDINVICMSFRFIICIHIIIEHF